MDVIHEVTTFLDRWRYLSIAVILAGGVGVVGLGGCEATGKSPTTGETLTAPALADEAEAVAREKANQLAKAGASYDAAAAAAQAEYERTLGTLATAFAIESADIEESATRLAAKYRTEIERAAAQQQKLTELFSFGTEIATAVNPAVGGVLGVVGAILGLGGIMDGRRKGSVIETLKGNNARLAVEAAQARTAAAAAGVDTGAAPARSAVADALSRLRPSAAPAGPRPAPRPPTPRSVAAGTSVPAPTATVPAAPPVVPPNPPIEA